MADNNIKLSLYQALLRFRSKEKAYNSNKYVAKDNVANEFSLESENPVQNKVIAAKFNELNEHINDTSAATNLNSASVGYLLKAAENQKIVEITVELTNSEEYRIWFNNSATTVAFPANLLRNNLDYTVQWEAVSVTGGDLGDVVISAKQLNGFTVAYTGTATAATLKLYIQGGLWQC